MGLLVEKPRDDWDVIVLGSGLAGTAAALSAHEAGARVLVVEKAPRESAGGSTRFSGGGFRIPREGYSEEEFFEDLMLVTQGRGNRELLGNMVRRASSDVSWLQEYGLQFVEGDAREVRRDREAMRVRPFVSVPQSFQIDGATQVGGGNGVVQSLHKSLLTHVDVVCDTKAEHIRVNERRHVCGVEVFSHTWGYQELTAPSLVIATGGFQANQEMRARYFGREACHWRVRGTRYNVGDGIKMATDLGAALVGEYADIHCAVIDARSRAMECGETNVNTYPFGIIVNMAGERFLDEGEDFRDRTYAKFGKSILAQPGSTAYLIFDQGLHGTVINLIKEWTPTAASTVPELATALGIDPEGLSKTVREFNRSIDRSIPFNWDTKDGRATQGLDINKSNWAVELESPPYYALPITGGVTFTFGGIRTNIDAEVMDTDGYPITGLFAAGEIQGDFFYYNYPSGSSLVRASVYGRTAGTNAAKRAHELVRHA